MMPRNVLHVPLVPFELTDHAMAGDGVTRSPLGVLHLSHEKISALRELLVVNVCPTAKLQDSPALISGLIQLLDYSQRCTRPELSVVLASFVRNPLQVRFTAVPNPKEELGPGPIGASQVAIVIFMQNCKMDCPVVRYS